MPVTYNRRLKPMTTKSRNVFTYYVKRVDIYYFIQRHSVNISEQCEACWAALPFILSWKNYSLMSVEAIPDSFMKGRNILLSHGKHFWDAKIEEKKSARDKAFLVCFHRMHELLWQ